MDSRFISITVNSTDGTQINYYTIGNGPGLVIVHGTFRMAKDYEQLALSLADTFTVHLVERRGRGNSGPQGEDYNMAKEVEDVEAILRYTNSPFLFGHSFGGAVALEVALNKYPIKKFAIYEPAIIIDNPLPVHRLPAIYEALDSGDYSKAFIGLMNILTEGAITEDKLTEMAASLVNSPVWPQMCELLQTIPAEMMAVHNNESDYAQYQFLQTRLLLMYGGNSQASTKNENKILAEIIPNTETAEVANAGHNGPDVDDPQQVADQLKQWFK